MLHRPVHSRWRLTCPDVDGDAVTLFIDPPQWPAHGRLFAHLISDVSYDELHRFAARVGLHPRSFDGDHYDIPEERHAEVVAAGATLVEGRDLARRLNVSGLRIRKRKGERALVRHHDVIATVDGPHTLDVLASPIEPPERTTTAAAVFVVDRLDRILLVHNVARDAWEAPAGGREAGESPRDTGVREVREETGVRLDPSALVPVGYERVTQSRPSARWPHVPVCHIAIYAATLDHEGSSLVRQVEEVRDLAWVPVDEVEGRSGGEFWWPLLQHHLQQRGGGIR